MTVKLLASGVAAVAAIGAAAIGMTPVAMASTDQVGPSARTPYLQAPNSGREDESPADSKDESPADSKSKGTADSKSKGPAGLKGKGLAGSNRPGKATKEREESENFEKKGERARENYFDDIPPDEASTTGWDGDFNETEMLQRQKKGGKYIYFQVRDDSTLSPLERTPSPVEFANSDTENSDEEITSVDGSYSEGDSYSDTDSED